MRVFLLNASGSAAGGNYQMPLSLPCLGAYLRRLGHEVSAIDMNFPSAAVPGRYLAEDPEMVRRIVEFKPDMLGISCTTVVRHNARFWAALMKEHLPKLKVVVGGPHVSYQSHQVLERWQAVDYVIRFEGELPLGMLIERLENDEPLDDVPGLSYRDESGKVCDNERSGLIQDLDTLPSPDWTVYDEIDAMISNYSPVVVRDGQWITGPTIHTMTSRGCPFLCKFCSTSHFWQGKVRFRSPEHVIKELKYYKSRWPWVKNIIFHDDTITLRRSHIKRICELMIEEGLDYRWKAWSRLDILDDELLALMKRAGCVCVLCGVEAGSQRGLQLVGKKIKIPRLMENTARIEKSGMGALYSFIAGIPGETPEESMTSIRLARRLESANAIANVYLGTTIFPGTAFANDMELEQGAIDWEDPAPAIRPLFGDDGFGNAIAPTVMHDPEVVGELGAALGLPKVDPARDGPGSGAITELIMQERARLVRQWSPYVLAQAQRLAPLLPVVPAEAPFKALSLRGRGKESVLATMLADRYDDFDELALPDPVMQGFPNADEQLDELFADVPTGGFDLVVDLNSLTDLRELTRTKIVGQLRRAMAPGAAAIFFHQNPDHLTRRAARTVRAASSLVSQRRPSVKAFRTMLAAAGFDIAQQSAAGIGLPAVLTDRLPPKVADAIGALRLPKSLGIWSVLVCRSNGTKPIAPAPTLRAVPARPRTIPVMVADDVKV